MKAPEAIDPVPQPVSSAGTTLRNTREEWELTVAEVASNLNLGTETIEAIEADDYSTLPGTTFVKGYIRSYAKLLQLDVEGLMGNIDLQPERITEIPSTRAALRMKGKTRNREKGKKKSGFLKWFVTLIVVAAVIMLGLSQLPKLGIESVNELLGNIGIKAEQPGTAQPENQLLIPQQSGTASPASDGQSGATQLNQPSQSNQSSQLNQPNQPKGALIRIE